MKDIVVVVGNGFSIDLCKNYFPEIDTATPLNRNYIIDQNPAIMARAAFPRVFQAWEDFRFNGGGQFDFFREIKCRGEMELEVEARHLLAMCYSDISRRLYIPVRWKWAQFFKSIAHRLRAAISFNYDRVLEGVFSSVGVQYSQNELVSNCIPLLKPHGSCNMDCHPMAISGLSAEYPLLNFLNSNDYQQFLVDARRLMQPRLEAFCILPHEENLYKEFQWQGGIWSSMRSNFGPVEHCILIGHSYGPADQPEIDEIVSKLACGAVLHLCNPYPPETYERLCVVASEKGVTVNRCMGDPPQL